jgi:hypothetical protein
MAGISIIEDSVSGSGSSAIGSPEGLGSCGTCIRVKGVMGMGPRLPPGGDGGAWMALKNGSPRTSLAGRALSLGCGSSVLGAVAPDGPRSPRKRLSAAATLA